MNETLINAWRRKWQPTPVFLPGKFHGQRTLVGCSPWGLWGSDTTEQLHFHFSPSCIREGNGNPLQCSCLENPRDGGAWWGAFYGVTQSWTRLKWLSSSSSSCMSETRVQYTDLCQDPRDHRLGPEDQSETTAPGWKCQNGDVYSMLAIRL